MHIGIITIFTILGLFIIFKQYAAILVSMLMIVFYFIVVESGKFPRLQKFFDDAF